MSVRPCIYPGCDRDGGDPELTDLGICDPCQRRYRHLIENLVCYWAFIRTTMPQPARREITTVRTARTSFGHPAEWASDLAADIAAKLNWTHDALADQLGSEPPPHDHAPELVRVRAAWAYLEPRIDRLSTLDSAADIAQELYELHGKAHGGLGRSRLRIWLKGVPCMNCGLLALTLVDGDAVECGGCRWRAGQSQFGLLARHAIDAMIDAYDAQHADHDAPSVA